jgi:hypothetical protein
MYEGSCGGFVDIVFALLREQVPPWQGARVPLLIFKVFVTGTTAGSDPYYIDIDPPSASTAWGATGAVTSFASPVVAAANGTTRVRISGDNIGTVGTSIIFLNSFLSRVEGEFTDCTRDVGYVECTAPPGVGARDDGDVASSQAPSPLRIALLQPGLMCDPAEQSQQPQWNKCTVIVDPSSRDITPDQGWAFQYATPVVIGVEGSVATSGGRVTVSGYNFGQRSEDIVAWMQPRVPSRSRMDLVTDLEANITTDPVTGVQSFALLVGPGLGVNWTIMFTVRDQLVNMSTAEQTTHLRFSYAAAIVSALSRTTGSTSGGYNVTIVGTNFGSMDTFNLMGGAVYVEDKLDGSAAVGFPPVPASILEVNQTAITFAMPASQGIKRVYVESWLLWRALARWCTMPQLL